MKEFNKKGSIIGISAALVGASLIIESIGWTIVIIGIATAIGLGYKIWQMKS